MIREAAAEAGVATQMGTQIHAGDNYRRVVELMQAGAIGPVSEVPRLGGARLGLARHARTRPRSTSDIVFVQDRPAEDGPVPAGLDWDLWLGPAPARPFNDVYFPGPKWYRWWDFGNGTMSDLGSHWIDLPFWALKLEHPLTIEAQRPAAPSRDRPRLDAGDVRVRASRRPAAGAADLVPGHATSRSSGQKGDIPQWGERRPVRRRRRACCSPDYGKHMLLPEEKFADFTRPPNRSIPKSRRPPRRNGSTPARPASPRPATSTYAGLADRGESPGQRRLSRRQEAGVGRREHARDERSGGRALPLARPSPRLDPRVA